MFWSSKPAVITDENRINDILTRGVENVIPRELALKKLRSGERIKIYFGIDPTGSKLHIGHTVPLRKLKQFADLGHEIILVVGSFTAMIGDPTDREAARAVLTREQVEENFKDYKRQAGKVLDLSKVEVRYNHEWLDPLKFEKLIELASTFTVQQMLQRDMFDKRMKEGKPISLHEFLYPLMVGYDSLVLDVDGELGGSDQEFNMLAGRHLQTAFKKKDKFVLTTKLIAGTDGRKMSKSYNNSVYLDDAPNDMFGKLMSVGDDLVQTYFDVCTDVPKDKVQGILAGHPKEAKMALAEEITRMYHGDTAAQSAKAAFDKTFSKGEVPDDVQEITIGGEGLMGAIVAAGVVTSKTDYRRLLSDGAIRIVGTDEKLTEHSMPASGTVIRVGKHRFVKIK